MYLTEPLIPPGAITPVITLCSGSVSREALIAIADKRHAIPMDAGCAGTGPKIIALKDELQGSRNSVITMIVHCDREQPGIARRTKIITTIGGQA
jgi:hypothetical protein